MIRWGIIGAGNIANRFAVSLVHEERSVLYAISGRNEEKLKAFREKHSCEKIYTSHEALLNDPDVDAVYIALPHKLHKEWALKALARHIPVLCEKPAGLSEEEVREIAEAAREHDTLFMEAMKCRFTPAAKYVDELIRKGEIGEVTSVSADFCFQMPAEMVGKTYHSEKVGGGCLLDTGIYAASWLERYTEGDPVVVKTRADYGREAETYVISRLQFGSVSAGLEAGFDRNSAKEAVIVGEKGTIVVDHMQRPDVIHVYTDSETTIAKPYVCDDFYGEIAHFASLVDTGKKESPIMPLAASIRCARILDIIRASFTEFNESDLRVLEAQEDVLQYASFTNADAYKLGTEIISLTGKYGGAVAVRIIREPEDLIVFQHIMDGKAQRNLNYADMKRAEALKARRSSAWVYLKERVRGEQITVSGGAFPIRLTDGTHVATVVVSGLHEGYDHDLIVEALGNVLGVEAPVFTKALL